MKGILVDENISNLTSTCNEASLSSSNRNEMGTLYPQQSFAPPNNQRQPTKKKRNLPGNPDPEADVIALSPRALMATNRFMCEICNKGFQRDQNLQLHRRGHNLPWKLKQRANKEEIRKKVYVCPEPTCVHHDPSRALGDLTGIKKHFCRKHGEKKWKCDKCSKRYAVQSDWKAHSKICGTREYRCDCGTLFSRRDSFITHRAFCDALAEESARTIKPNPNSNPLLPLQSPLNSTTRLINLHTQPLQPFSLKTEQDEQLFSSRLDLDHYQPIMHYQNPNPNLALPSLQLTAASSPHMSATALLQKAAQMGVTMSKPCPVPETMFRPHQAHMGTTGFGSTVGNCLGLSSREEMGFVHGLSSFGNKAVVTSGCMEAGATVVSTHQSPTIFHDMMSSLSSTSGFEGSSFEEVFNGVLNKKGESGNFQETLPKPAPPETQVTNASREGNDGFTRDFLGLRAFPHRNILNMAGLDPLSTSTSYHLQNQNQTPW